MYRIFILMTIALIFPSTSFSQTATCSLRKCSGEYENEYNDGYYHYRTKSRVYADNNDPVKDHIYETCVENLGKNDLEVNWVIPGPDTVVPVGCAVPAYRPHSSRDTIETYRTCLRYGAKWEWDKSPFYPHASEREAISEEREKSCEELHLSDRRTIDSIVRNIKMVIERFGPSVHREFDDTLTRMNFDVSIDVNSEEGIFQTSIIAEFSNAYVEQPNHYLKGFIIRPSDALAEQNFFKGAQGNPLGGFFGESGSIVYTLEMPVEPVQTFVRYAIFSIDDRQVASFDVPIWVELE